MEKQMFLSKFHRQLSTSLKTLHELEAAERAEKKKKRGWRFPSAKKLWKQATKSKTGGEWWGGEGDGKDTRAQGGRK